MIKARAFVLAIFYANLIVDSTFNNLDEVETNGSKTIPKEKSIYGQNHQ